MTDTQSTPFVNTPEILYRLRAANGILLYVGVTRDFPSRLKQHHTDKPWANEIRATEQVHIDGTRAQIEAIEKAVIIAEKPKYNITHNPAPASADRLQLEHYGEPLLRYTSRDGQETEYRVGDMVQHPEHMYGYIVTATYGHDDGALVQFKHCRAIVPWESLTWWTR